MRVIAKKTLRDFWNQHTDCEQQLKSWFQEAEKAQWKTSNQVQSEYPNARVIENRRVIFNIKGNNYRLIIKVNYKYGMIWIRFIGTHAEYDNIDPKTI